MSTFCVTHPLEDQPEEKRDVDPLQRCLSKRATLVMAAFRFYLLSLAIGIGLRLIIR
jgi:hypothetical protein